MEEFIKGLMNCLDEARKNGEKKVQANDYNDEMKKNVIGRELDIAYSSYILDNVSIIDDIFQEQIRKTNHENKILFKQAFELFYLDKPTSFSFNQTKYNPSIRKKLGIFVDTAKIINSVNKKELNEEKLESFVLQSLLPIKFACHMMSNTDIEKVHPIFVNYLERNDRNAIQELIKWEKISDNELGKFIDNETTFNFLDEEKGMRESE